MPGLTARKSTSPKHAASVLFWDTATPLAANLARDAGHTSDTRTLLAATFPLVSHPESMAGERKAGVESAMHSFRFPLTRSSLRALRYHRGRSAKWTYNLVSSNECLQHACILCDTSPIALAGHPLGT